MDDPNITMEEYIKLMADKARGRDQTFNWETTTYGKEYCDDLDSFTDFETDFPVIAYNDASTSNQNVFSEPTISIYNAIKADIDFHISFSDSEDEDYTFIYNKDSSSYKLIPINDLKPEPVNMDDPTIIMEEYIRLEEEIARKRGKVYNWETAKYGKIWYDEDVHDLRSVETEFPAIVFDDAFTSEVTPSYEPTPTVSYFDDLDFFKDFEKEFPAIVYNDALTSKSDFLTETTVSPQHIDEFNLKDETSLSECEKEEQNVLYFNDLFPFNVIYPDDSKSDKDIDDDKIDIKHSSGDLSIEPLPNIIKIDAQWSNKLFETSHDTSIIMESLMKTKLKGAILELKRRHLKNTNFCTYTSYPAKKIRRINANSSQETRIDQFPIRRITLYQYALCTAGHQSKIRI
ncbi:hypothetical protein Tco_0873204 [Tanacetum coccineum]